MANLKFIAAITFGFLNLFTCVTTKCSLAEFNNRILTCTEIELPKFPLEDSIKTDTFVIAIKSSLVEIPSNYHANGNFQHVTSYELSGNVVKQLDDSAFNKMDALRYLKINDNTGWDVIKSNTFNGLNKLETLTIVNNSLTKVEENSFAHLDELDVLELTHNNLQTIPSKAFKDLKKATSLFLSHNNIEGLKEGCFEGLQSVSNLDLTYNKIRLLKTSVFKDLPQLAYLYLSHNELTDIQGEFPGNNLKFIYLHHNRLHSISGDLFKSLPGLKSVDLSYNEIESIDDGMFEDLDEIELITLSHNGFKERPNLKFKFGKEALVVL